MQDLYVYQQSDKKQVPAKFMQQNGVWQFQLNDYDKTQPLIIDPLIYSTYIGGSNDDYGYAIAIDSSGNAYITGYTHSTDYDITSGVFQITFGGIYKDIFVTKLNSTGTALIYSTYIGGYTYDEGKSIAIDSSGNAYITGYTESNNYPTTPGAFQTTNGGGGSDVFVTKLNSTGTALIYSTYIGGSNVDQAYGIAIDGSGNAYITGYTYSNNFDITTGVFQTNNGGGRDVFVTQLNSTGTGLIYSTYIGGGSGDEGFSIAVDGSGNAYITGYTGSPDYDITPGAFQTTNEGGTDVFVTKLNSTGTALIYSTYIGGSNQDNGRAIAIDSSGNAYITGLTRSTDYDITSGAFQTTLSYIGAGSYYYDVFVTKLNSTGTSLIYSTYIGGSGDDYGNSIAVDDFGNAYIAGIVNSANDFDITPGAFQTSSNPGINGFVTKLNSTGTALIYSSFIGQSGSPANGITIDSSGKAYITGYTNSNNYPTTPGAFQTTKDGGSDVFVLKLDFLTTTGMETLVNKEEIFSIYPNPNKGSFIIQSTKGGVFELMDVTGKVINTYTITNTQQTVKESLPPGMYFVREKESGSVQKLIIE
jgi:cold shock CspA family protein